MNGTRERHFRAAKRQILGRKNAATVGSREWCEGFIDFMVCAPPELRRILLRNLVEYGKLPPTADGYPSPKDLAEFLSCPLEVVEGRFSALNEATP